MKLLLLPLLLGFSVPAIAHKEANITRTYNFAITVDPENPPHGCGDCIDTPKDNEFERE